MEDVRFVLFDQAVLSKEKIDELLSESELFLFSGILYDTFHSEKDLASGDDALLV